MLNLTKLKIQLQSEKKVGTILRRVYFLRFEYHLYVFQFHNKNVVSVLTEIPRNGCGGDKKRWPHPDQGNGG